MRECENLKMIFCNFESMKYVVLMSIVFFTFFYSCKKVEEIPIAEKIAKQIEGEWEGYSLLRDDEYLPLDDNIIFTLKFYNIEGVNGDYHNYSKTPDFGNMNNEYMEYSETNIDSKFTVNEEGKIISVLNYFDYDISFQNDNLILLVKDSGATTKIVYRKI